MCQLVSAAKKNNSALVENDMLEQTVEKVDQAVRSNTGLLLLCGAVAIWIVYRWLRGGWLRYQSNRRRKAFDSRKERNWQGHRRESSEVTRLDGKK
jgi:hypothetical protein